MIKRILETEQLVNEGLCHRKSIMTRLDTYGDNYRSVPILVPNEAEAAAAAAVRTSLPSMPVEAKPTKSAKKRKSMSDPPPMPHPPAASLPDQNDQKKLSKDPNLPKRPHNAFFYFSQERRPAMQKQFPDLTKKEIATMLSQKWSELPPSEKSIYLQLQNERKRQYQAIMARYNEGRGSDSQM